MTYCQLWCAANKEREISNRLCLTIVSPYILFTDSDWLTCDLSNWLHRSTLYIQEAYFFRWFSLIKQQKLLWITTWNCAFNFFFLVIKLGCWSLSVHNKYQKNFLSPLVWCFGKQFCLTAMDITSQHALPYSYKYAFVDIIFFLVKHERRIWLY